MKEVNKLAQGLTAMTYERQQLERKGLNNTEEYRRLCKRIEETLTKIRELEKGVVKMKRKKIIYTLGESYNGAKAPVGGLTEAQGKFLKCLIQAVINKD